MGRRRRKTCPPGSVLGRLLRDAPVFCAHALGANLEMTLNIVLERFSVLGGCIFFESSCFFDGLHCRLIREVPVCDSPYLCVMVLD